MNTFFEQKTVLITGVAGFIGSHLAERALKEGATVIGVDNFISGRRHNMASFEDHPDFTFIEANVSQPVEKYLPSDAAVDVILHFASPASPPRYQAAPVETYLVNSLATHYLLTYLKDNRPDARFLFASTSEVYGDPEVHPQPESYWGNVNPNGVRSCYDEAKRLGESICGVHARDFGLDVRIIRIFNTYGPRMNPEDGRVIPQFASQVIQGQDLTLYGDGSQTRSYCYVDDLVAGIFAMVASPDAKGKTVNLGNPGEFTVKQTAEIIFRHLNTDPSAEPHYENFPLPKDDPIRRRPDITLAKELLGWSPQVSFEEGLKPTLEYFTQELQKAL